MTEQAVETVVPSSRPADLLPPAADATADLRVAHLLLRSGNALPARVQLETLAGRHQLDIGGLLDLAESRWRTGDLGGAGEAIVAYLEGGGQDAVGYLIAAEATSALGRPGEARKLARRALEGLTLSLDAVFAGLPRSSIWPDDPAAPAQPAGTLFAPLAAEAARGGRIGLTGDGRPTVPAGPTTPPGSPNYPGQSGEPSPATAFGPATSPNAVAEHGRPPSGSAAMPAEQAPNQSLWDVGRDAPAPIAATELDAARAALAADDPRGAAVRLAIVLRMSPVLAPAVLDLAGQLPGVDFDLLRGDALRLVGREAAAERSFAAAAEALREPSPTRSPE